MPMLLIPGVETTKNPKQLEAELEALLRTMLQYGLLSKIA
jgi:hypothetical protein